MIVTERKPSEPVDWHRERTINLNINNFKISYREIGGNIANMKTIGKDLEELDASRTLMSKLEEISNRGKNH